MSQFAQLLFPVVHLWVANSNCSYVDSLYALLSLIRYVANVFRQSRFVFLRQRRFIFFFCRDWFVLLCRDRIVLLRQRCFVFFRRGRFVLLRRRQFVFSVEMALSSRVDTALSFSVWDKSISVILSTGKSFTWWSDGSWTKDSWHNFR